MPINIAIDGPVGAGKSSIADRVAERLNILHLDTGAMYRAFGLYALRSGVDMASEEALSALVEKVDVQVEYAGGAQRTLLFGEDVSDLIRTGEVSAAASAVSKWPAVRRHMVRAQQEGISQADFCLRSRRRGLTGICAPQDAEARFPSRRTQCSQNPQTAGSGGSPIRFHWHAHHHRRS